MPRSRIAVVLTLILFLPDLSAAAQRQPLPVFVSTGAETVLDDRNGFKVTARPGRFERSGIEVRGAEAVVDSPWGEKMVVRFWLDDTVLFAEIDGGTTVATSFDGAGKPVDMVVERAGTITHSPIDNRAERFLYGQATLESFDLSTYGALWGALQEDHSEAFLGGLAALENDLAVPVGCTLEAIGCGAAVASWILTVGGVVAGCTISLGMPIFTPGCLIAIIGHELANVGVVTSCVSYSNCQQDVSNNGHEHDQNCSHPGGQE